MSTYFDRDAVVQVSSWREIFPLVVMVMFTTNLLLPRIIFSLQ